MAMKKLFDLAVKTGSYVDNQGNEKGRYENVGSMMQGDHGPFLFLKTTFNPAGVPNPDGRDSVLISMFEPKEQQQQQPQQRQSGAAQDNNWGSAAAPQNDHTTF